MATKLEFLVAKKQMLVALYIVSSLATISVAFLSLGMVIRILSWVKPACSLVTTTTSFITKIKVKG